jgi:hypothetical protein
MERGNFVKVNDGAITTCLPDQSGTRAIYLEKDLYTYDRIGLVVKVKDNDLVCLSFGAEVYWFNKYDLSLMD